VIYNLQAFNLEFANHHATVDADDEQSCSQQRKRMSSASEELLGDLVRCEPCSLVFLDMKCVQGHKRRIHGNRQASIEEK